MLRIKSEAYIGDHRFWIKAKPPKTLYLTAKTQNKIPKHVFHNLLQHGRKPNPLYQTNFIGK